MCAVWCCAKACCFPDLAPESELDPHTTLDPQTALYLQTADVPLHSDDPQTTLEPQTALLPQTAVEPQTADCEELLVTYTGVLPLASGDPGFATGLAAFMFAGMVSVLASAASRSR